jgi:hypothetical protein
MINNDKAARPILDIFTEAEKLVHKKSQGSISEYLKRKSQEIDEFILSEEKKHELNFISGEVTIKSENSDFIVNFYLYFKSKSGDWEKKTITLPPSQLEWEFTREEQEKISSGRMLTFEYIKPVLDNK